MARLFFILFRVVTMTKLDQKLLDGRICRELKKKPLDTAKLTYWICHDGYAKNKSTVYSALYRLERQGKIMKWRNEDATSSPFFWTTTS